MTPRGAAQRIADDLRAQIGDGRLQPGAMLLSETDLAYQYNVSRGTVRSALSKLVDDQLIEVRPGVGRRVSGGPGDDRRSAYGRIAADFAEEIDSGKLAPGSALPSEVMVMRKYDVSRNTVRRAYKVLVESGAVVVRHGVGAFVRSAES